MFIPISQKMELYFGLYTNDVRSPSNKFNNLNYVPPSPSRDVFTAMRNGNVCRVIKELLIDHIQKADSLPEAIVGLDARGFLFGFMLAAELNLPFIPIRKKGKLPGKCLSYEYTLEYGSDQFEMQEDSLRAGQRVVIVDDLLATGGTLSAACELVKAAGGIVDEIVVLIELTALNGRRKVPVSNVHSFLSYDD